MALTSEQLDDIVRIFKRDAASVQALRGFLLE